MTVDGIPQVRTGVLADRTNQITNVNRNKTAKPVIKPATVNVQAPVVQVQGVMTANANADTLRGVQTRAQSRAQLRRRRSEVEMESPRRDAPAVRMSNPDRIPEPEMLPIDIKNAADELWCAEYVCEIFKNLKEEETTYQAVPNYMEMQTDINEKMRSIMVDWLVEVHNKFKLQIDCLYLCMNLVDRYLSMKRVSRNALQLVGVTCMLIAAKYEEIYPPEIRDFVHITDRAYTREQIIAMEIEILNTLEFHVTVPLPIRFLQRYMQAAEIEENSVRWEMAHFLLELTLPEYTFLNNSPSMLACAALFLTNRLMAMHTDPKQQVSSSWPPELVKYTGVTDFSSDRSVRDCTKLILTTLCAAKNTSLQAILRKYQKETHSGCIVSHNAGVASSNYVTDIWVDRQRHVQRQQSSENQGSQ